MSKKLSCIERCNICRKTTDPAVLDEYVGDSAMKVRCVVAQNKNTSEDALDILSRDSNSDVRELVAINPKTSENTLVEMAKEANGTMAYNIMGKRKVVPSTVIRILADSSDPNVRLWVASGSQTTLEFLDELSGDEDASVRAAVAGNRNTPPELLDQMVEDSDNVKSAIAGNPNTETKTLERMRGIPSLGIQRQLANNKNTPEDMLRDLATSSCDRYVLTDLAGNPSTPLDVLEMLMGGSSEYRRRMSSNPRLTETMIRKIFDSELDQDNRFVMRGLAENPSTPLDILEKLAVHEDVYARSNVAINPSTPDELRLKIINGLNNEYALAEVMEQYEVTSVKKKAV